MLAYPEVAHCKVIKAQIQPTSTFRSLKTYQEIMGMAICKKMFLKTLDFSAVADDIKLFVGNLEVGICSKKILRSKKFKVSNL